jgi:quinol-cytochrome oxidoreductase complex cytochrome b subunit
MSGVLQTNQNKGLKNKTMSKGRSFLNHLHPPRLPEASIRFNRTFGLGGLSALLFAIQLFTGILLRFEYVPVPANAYDSILFIENEVFFGQFVRNLHHWAGMFFVVVVFLHFIRVFLSQSIYGQRKVNWLIGMALFFLAMFSNFTGYLLPWDQLSYWAVTVATSMLSYVPLVGEYLMFSSRGGVDVSAETLLNFYSFHTGLFPIVIFVLLIYHFWKVRKAKGVALPLALRDGDRVPSYPNLVFKELVVGLVFISILFLLSAFADAPLQERANPALSPNPAKAPWYFMGIQELLLHIHPFFAAFVIPALFFGALIWIPYATFTGINVGQWFQSEKGKKMAMISMILSIIITPLYIILDEYLLNFEKWFNGLPQLISTGLLPFAFLMAGIYVFIVILKKIFKAQIQELIISVFVVFVTSYILLTIIGIYFRGEAMILTLPWNL